MNLDAIFEPTAHAHEHVSTLRFALMEWRVFEAISDPSLAVTARTFAQQLGLSPEAMSAILERLASAGLIHVPEVSYREFKARDSRSGSQPTVPEPRSPVSSPAAAEQQTSVSFTLRKRTRTPASTPNGSRSNASLKLGALLQVVRERAGGGSIGQLAVYRMFLKVPEDLLQAAGFDHLDLDTADMEVTDTRLAAALCETASEILNLPQDEMAKLLGAKSPIVSPV